MAVGRFGQEFEGGAVGVAAVLDHRAVDVAAVEDRIAVGEEAVFYWVVKTPTRNR